VPKPAAARDVVRGSSIGLLRNRRADAAAPRSSAADAVRGIFVPRFRQK